MAMACHVWRTNYIIIDEEHLDDLLEIFDVDFNRDSSDKITFFSYEGLPEIELSSRNCSKEQKRRLEQIIGKERLAKISVTGSVAFDEVLACLLSEQAEHNNLICMTIYVSGVTDLYGHAIAFAPGGEILKQVTLDQIYEGIEWTTTAEN